MRRIELLPLLLFSLISFLWPASPGSAQLVESSKLLASLPTDFGDFGVSVALSGSTVVVGAQDASPNGAESGVAYIFEEPPGGWSGGAASPLTETARLLPSDAQAGDHFGAGVALQGDTVVVGAVDTDGEGAVYVFEEPPGGWSGTVNEVAKLTVSSAIVNGKLGYAVGLEGPYVVAGAPSVEGRAYVWVQPPGGWTAKTEDALLTSSVPASAFGSAIAISGATVVVGSNFSGAWVFRQPPGGWTGGVMNPIFEIANLEGSDAPGVSGISVALEGDTAVMGAQEAAYVFVEPPGGWTGGAGTPTDETAKLLPSNGFVDQLFGHSVALSGGTVVVGTWEQTSGPGSGYVYVEPVGGWTGGAMNPQTETLELVASDAEVRDNLGFSASIDGSVIALGAFTETTAPGLLQGAAYVHRLQADLSITKDDGQDSAVPGELVHYTIEVENAGPGGVFDAYILDQPPGGLTCFWSCSETGGAVCPTGGFGGIDGTADLPASSTLTIEMDCQIDAAAQGLVVNTVTITPPSGVVDPNLGDNSATDSDTLVPTSDLQIVKIASEVEPIAGGPLDYQIEVTNLGPSVADLVTVTDLLPAGVTLVGTTGCAEDPVGVPQCTLGTLQPLEEVSILLEVMIDPEFLGPLANTASVAGFPVDPVDVNDSSTADVRVVGAGGVDIPTAGDTVLALFALLLGSLGALVLARKSSATVEENS